MATPFIIIDGYNLMHAAGVSRRSYGPGDLERCRHRLNGLLTTSLSESALARTTIVYDAFESVSNDARQQMVNGLSVLFAPKGQDADSVIEQLIQKHSAPRQLLIVSSDHRLHKAARRRRATCMDSEDFFDTIQSAPESAPLTTPESKRKPAPPNEDSAAQEASPLQRWVDDLENSDASQVADDHFDAEYLKELNRELGQSGD